MKEVQDLKDLTMHDVQESQLVRFKVYGFGVIVELFRFGFMIRLIVSVSLYDAFSCFGLAE